MKYKYSLTCLLLFFVSTIIFAQCPEFLGENSTKEYISFTIGEYPCDSYPEYIEVESNTFKKEPCNGFALEYRLFEGSPLSNVDNFEVKMDFGFCEYQNRELSSETLLTPEIVFADGLKIFPNPVSRNSFVVLKFSDDVTAQITVVDLTGKVVFKEVLENDNKIHLQVDTLPTGLYLINVISDKNIAVTRKLVIH